MTPEQKSDIEALATADPTITNSDVAKIVGVSDRRVSEVRAKMARTNIDSGESDVDREREEYARGLRKSISVSLRVRTLATLVKSKNPAVSLKALEMADRLSKYTVDNAVGQNTTNPIFSLPAGTMMKVTK